MHNLYIWSALTRILLRLFHHLIQPSSSSTQCQNSSVSAGSLPPCRRYIHRGTRRHYHEDASNSTRFLSSTTCYCPCNTGRSVDHSVLSSFPRSANLTACTPRHIITTINFVPINIRALSNKGHLIPDLIFKFDFLCVTETWQGLKDPTPPGFVYLCQLRCYGRIGDLAMIYQEKWKILLVPLPSFSSNWPSCLHANCNGSGLSAPKAEQLFGTLLIHLSSLFLS